MRKFTITILTLALLFTGCTPAVRSSEDYETEIQSLKAQLEDTKKINTQVDTLNQKELILAGTTVMKHIKDRDMDALSQWVHPQKGLLFKPYPSNSNKDTIVLTQSSLTSAYASKDVLTWGIYDGSGEPITFTVSEYFNRFVYDAPFIEPETISVNHTLSFGNAMTDFKTAYPNASYLEFHFSGFEAQYEGIDWKSLFLVFEKIDDNWYLIAIEHGEWTI